MLEKINESDCLKQKEQTVTPHTAGFAVCSPTLFLLAQRKATIESVGSKHP
jgi:hypothetical protein